MRTHINKFKNYKKWSHYLEKYKLLKLAQEEIQKLNKWVTIKGIKLIVKKNSLFMKKEMSTENFTEDSYQLFKEEHLL